MSHSETLDQFLKISSNHESNEIIFNLSSESLKRPDYSMLWNRKVKSNTLGRLISINGLHTIKVELAGKRVRQELQSLKIGHVSKALK